MKLVFVSYGSLPMPPVKGGAVENLSQMLIDENEFENRHHMVSIGCYNKKAVLTSQKYKNATYEFVKTFYMTNHILLFVSRIIRKLLRINIALGQEYYAYKVSRIINNKHKDADYIIVENGIHFGYYAKRTGIPVIYHAHNDWVGYGAFTERDASSICAVITISDYISDCFRKLNGIKLKKIYKLLNGVDETVFVKNEAFRRTYRKSCGIREDEVVCVYSGRIHPTKGVFELLTAFEKLKREDIYLLILGGINYSDNGSNDYSKKCDALINKLNDKVIRVGYVPYEKMPDYYSVADIGIMPSVWAEPGGRVLTEMQIMSLPIICTLTGGMGDYVNEENSILIPIDNLVDRMCTEIVRLADDVKLRKEISVKSYNNAKQFTKKRYFEEFCGIIEEIAMEGKECDKAKMF